MIRLLLVDDQIIVRQGLRVLLEAQADLEVVGEAENGQQAVHQVRVLQPDVVLMDIHMPELDGVAATQIVCQQFTATNVLVLTTFGDNDYVDRAIKFGAKGYLLKDTPAEELALAIRSVYKGHTHLGPGLLNKIILNASTSDIVQPPQLSTALGTLSPREKDVLRLIGTGANNREIAEALCIAESTVKNHITHILHRLNLRDRIQAVLLANSILPPG
jgi:DNA-binding NarL/FixJ family response regulator